MYKHKFNFLPVMSAEEVELIVADMKENGYDPSQPIVLYDGEILDGWNRYMAAQSLGIEPTFRDFEGDDLDAINFVMRSNKRRNLTSQQWAAVAVDAGEIVKAISEAVEKQKRIKQKQNAANQYTKTDNDEDLGKKEGSDNLLPQGSKDDTKTATKVAEMFNTNRTYVNEAKKLKETDPEQFEKVKKGEISLKKAKKLKEQPLEPTPLDHPHLNNLKFHGGLISEAAKLLKQRMDEYENYLHAGQYKAQKFAPRIHTTATRDVIDDVFLSSKSLRRLEICPLCTGKGCDKCHSLGLMEAQTAAAFKKEA
jgi:hypothetical protein